MNQPTAWRLDWPTAQQESRVSAVIKALPEHFKVDELLELEGFPSDSPGFDAQAAVSGEGEHLCVRLEKTGDNTEYVARELARLSGCRPHDIGLCGLKDRHAITRQWFSVYRPGKGEGDAAFLAEVATLWPILSVHRFRRKLRRGEHRANRFELVLTKVVGTADDINRRLCQLRDYGCPNYFGAQRFGWAGNNLSQAVRMKPGRQRGRNSRDGLYFSAARSWLFNEVLAARVEARTWNCPMTGEPLPGIVTGPLWGDGGTVATEEQGELERKTVAQHPLMAAVFSQTRMKPERRDLILLPEELSWQWMETDTLALSFTLMPGQFATSVMAELFSVTDASQAATTLAESR